MSKQKLKIQPTPRDHQSLKTHEILKIFMEKEWEFMWTKVWQIAGWASEIPNPDDFFVYKIRREEILVVRQKDNSIKAFFKGSAKAYFTKFLLLIK